MTTGTLICCTFGLTFAGGPVFVAYVVGAGFGLINCGCGVGLDADGIGVKVVFFSGGCSGVSLLLCTDSSSKIFRF